MMKNVLMKFFCLVLSVTVLAGMLGGCGEERNIRESVQTATGISGETAEATGASGEPTEGATELIEESTQSPTEETEASAPIPSQPESFQPYLETVYLADLPIFSGPSYDDGYVGIVEESGVYTIVEEAWDYEGNLWGRLKSGAGWINLTDSRLAEERQVPVSAGFASRRLLESGRYEQCIADASEYAVKIAIRFYEEVADVCVSRLEFDTEEFVAADTVGAFPKLTPDSPLVIWLSFPGDMSCYGIFFTDSCGQTHRYTISLSGRNGLVVLTEEAS